MKLTPHEWYDLGCQFSEISKKMEQIHMMLLIYLNENNYYIRIMEATCEHYDIILRNELISLLYKAYSNEDHLPGFDNLLLTDVFYNKTNIDETINYGRISCIGKSTILQLCREVISYIDRLYPVYGIVSAPTLNRIIINIQRIMNCLKKL
ncbi:hypothetical protein Klosneuvirus_3_231 [Klosneuvirus KNV1]|uniref:Uncharacterized protein n=1 Tax=Klosneuvirus KNV1 TaxID=1977640 RepID=A0A1V0SK53_9VIRU|nr:hypothetical protein Klosneuvirus_3_231 [Klosneuvirus KNV1]